MPSALILIADGTEEMEFTITYDTLVRAGVSCTSSFVPDSNDKTASVSPHVAKCSRGLRIMPDTYFDESESGPDKYDLLVIPGGAKGADTMSTSPAVQELVRKYITIGKKVGMICAGSLAAQTSRLPKQPLTSHPSVKQALERGFDYSESPVVISGGLITSRGPGTAFPFALTLVELLCGREKREEVRAPMIFPESTPF
ncbi:DJ-1 protein [Fistulina hepatica ATCC 64428]|uniref:D-lactate dehydratase n=1 Tax=Fistulina hepatica ATCC 64428 TaxID=1128425 RepID=A0A0D7A5V2_9AGAR|nr:DJ-1 protein [Fistulina hepatica ATCC 64428]